MAVTAPRESKLKTLLMASIDDMFKPSTHTLVVGRPRSGKTSFLLYATAMFHQKGENVVWRDIGEFFEWLSLIEEIPVLAFVPVGCKIHYQHPNFEQAEFHPKNLFQLFDSFNPKKLNVVVLDMFVENVKVSVKFWSSFFQQLLFYRKQPGKGRKPLCLIVDELNDLAPGKGRLFTMEQLPLSNFIGYNLRKFRRFNIRLVASTHALREIHPPVRERFDCYLFKACFPNPNEVPPCLTNYVKLLPKLSKDECIFVDQRHAFSQIKTPLFVEPKRFYDVDIDGRVDHLLETSEESSEDKIGGKDKVWRSRLIMLLKHLTENDIMSVTEIAHLWGVHPTAVSHLKRSVGDVSVENS